jgi:hypothetical protein
MEAGDDRLVGIEPEADPDGNVLAGDGEHRILISA